jgi:hypothetical protein
MEEGKNGIEEINEYPLSPAEPQDMPESTIWPFALAFGILLLFWGLITTYFLTIAGLIILGFSIAGWIVDLNHE